MAHAVLICDDDAEIRSTMRRTLRGYEVTEAGSPREALETLKATVFDAIVSDYAMGTDRDGLDLLQQVRLMYPEMIRFLVTGNREVEVAVRAVNEGRRAQVLSQAVERRAAADSARHRFAVQARELTMSLGRVLIVDDDPAMRKVCARVLEGEGWTTTVVEEGKAAEAAVTDRQQLFDCVVSDVNMPGMDGFAVAAAVRRHDPDLPVLLMTGDPSLDGAVKALDSGAVSYLSKPFSHEMLAASVARAARQHGVKRMRKRAESYAKELAGPKNDHVEERFQRALDQMWMAFQPIVDVQTRTVYAYEALLRTEEPTLRRPDLVIATAERLDRIHDLGRAVRAAVGRAAVDAPPDSLLFVNVHGLELTDEELFASDGPLAAMSTRVVLEITERIGIDETAGPARVAMLRRLGYRIAVDDLGAGYAALGALAMLEPDVVKLDMSLVRDLDRHPTKRRVVGAITTLCRELGSKVVAEGVETEVERKVLTDLGIDLLQGYLFARPARGFPIPSW